MTCYVEMLIWHVAYDTYKCESIRYNFQHMWITSAKMNPLTCFKESQRLSPSRYILYTVSSLLLVFTHAVFIRAADTLPVSWLNLALSARINQQLLWELENHSECYEVADACWKKSCIFPFPVKVNCIFLCLSCVNTAYSSVLVTLTHR